MSSTDSRIPVSVITGFLGAGKTTLLSALLKHPEMRRTAVIINEFGEIGLDHDLVETSDETIVEVNGGCLCCTVRGDLARAIKKLNIQRIKGEVQEFDRIVVETTGLADPAPILQTLALDPVMEHDFRLEGVVTLVDGVNGMSTLDRQIEAVKQAAVADRIIVTKADLAGDSELAPLERRLRSLNPAAALLRVVQGGVSPDRLFDAGPWDARTKSADVERWLNEAAVAEHGHHHHHPPNHGHVHHDVEEPHGHDVNRHDDRIHAFCLRRPEAIPRAAVAMFLDLLTAHRGDDLLRVKGILRIAEEPERPLVIHAVQHVVHEPIELDRWPSADRDSRLVFITRDIPQESVVKLWDAMTTAFAAGMFDDK